MRSFVKTLMLAVALTVCCGTVCAQKSDKQQRLTREQLAEKQARHIAGVMAMDDATSERFVDTYCKCQKEIWALGPRRGKAVADMHRPGPMRSVRKRLKTALIIAVGYWTYGRSIMRNTASS